VAAVWPVMELTCPKCHGTMRTYERNGVHVDQCGDCRGIFLDRGELERLIDAENDWHGETRAPKPAPVADGRYRSDHDRDDDRYREQQRAAASSGGLGSVVSEVLGQVQGRSHSDSRYGSQPYKKRRKESFLSDLFG
jgi:Zn-finger nucleic acid-binding protein